MRTISEIVINSIQLRKILDLHKKWVLSSEGGARANLTGAYLTGADLTRADLTGAYLTGAYLTRAYLTRADLTGAYLTRANLTGAYLTRADLTGADLTGAYLTRAYLTRANLTGADLTGANLTGADLTGADLTRADLTGANLRGAIGVYQFGPIDNEGRIGYAVASNDGPMFALGCHWGNLADTRKAIVAKYGKGSLYEKQVVLAREILEGKKIIA